MNDPVAVTLQLDRDVIERLDTAAERHGISRDALAETMLSIELDVDEGRRDHVPMAVRESLPRLGRNGTIAMPSGRVFDRR